MTQEQKNSLETIRARISDLKKMNINEAQTKEWLIRPFFEALGWDFSNPYEVVPEDADTAGKRCDYRFCINNKTKLLVEAKPLNHGLEDTKMIIDKLSYCSSSGVPLLIITNGDLYKIYYSELKGVGNDKLLDEFSLSNDINYDLIEKLSKNAFQNNVLLNYARNISLLINIKNAIQKLFNSPNKKLLNSINNEVKENLGHTYGDQDIEKALKQFTIEINTDIENEHIVEQEKGSVENDKEKDVEKTSWTIEHQFKDGYWKDSFNLYKKLIEELKNKGLKFKEKPTKFYIGLIPDKYSFCQIHGRKIGLKIRLRLQMNEISKQASSHFSNVSNISLGEIECIVKDEKDFEWLIPIIQKAYEKIISYFK